MANEIISSLFGIDPRQEAMQREQVQYSRALQEAQLSGRGRNALSSSLATQRFGGDLQQVANKLFNIEDPQMKDARLTDLAFNEVNKAGVDPMSTAGLQQIGQLLTQQGASPRALERLSAAYQQAQEREAAMGLKAAQASKYTAEATRVQEEAAREQKMREELAALPPDATPQQRYAVVAKYASPDKQLAGIDYQARLAAEKEARIEQAKLRHDQRMEELRQQNASRAELAAAQRANSLELQRMRMEDRADARSEKAAEKQVTEQEKRQQMVPAFDSALATLDRVDKHPGKKAGVGFGGAQISLIPGTDAAGFRVQLETFKAQTFLPMVQSLKGMGALSDAEGKKLTDAVGALSPDMPEKEFNAQIAIIRKDLEDAKARALGKKDSPVGKQPTKTITVDY